jgi:hypothetical protein
VHRAQPRAILLELARGSGGALEIRARRNEAAEGAVAARLAEHGGDDRLALHLVRYTPSASVEIEAGENAGRRAEYHNIVTSWQTLATWDMGAPLEMTVQVDGGEPLVVLVQERGQGKIVAAARLR